MKDFQGVEMLLQKDDIITSKKGILIVNTPLSKKDFIVTKLKYLGDGIFEILSEKEEVKSRKVYIDKML